MKYKIIKAFIITTFVSLNMIACDAKNVSNNSKTANTDTKIQKIEKKAEVKKMSMEDLHKLQSEKKNEKDILIVDVRTAEEYEAGHIRYAINYSLDDFEDTNESEIWDLAHFLERYICTVDTNRQFYATHCCTVRRMLTTPLTPLLKYVFPRMKKLRDKRLNRDSYGPL